MRKYMENLWVPEIPMVEEVREMLEESDRAWTVYTLCEECPLIAAPIESLLSCPLCFECERNIVG